MSFFGNIEATLSIAVASDASVPDPQNSTLSESDFAALTWEPIPNIVTGPDTGGTTNFNEVEVWDERFTSAFKGGTSGAESELVLAISTNNTSDGRTAVLAAGGSTDTFAFKYEWPNGRIEYFRALIGDPNYSKGTKEDPPQETLATKVVEPSIISST